MKDTIILTGDNNNKYLQIISICKNHTDLRSVLCCFSGGYGHSNEMFMDILTYDFIHDMGFNLSENTESKIETIKNGLFNYVENSKLKYNDPAKMCILDDACDVIHSLENFSLQCVRFANKVCIEDLDNEDYENPDLNQFVPGLLSVNKFTDFVYKKRELFLKGD